MGLRHKELFYRPTAFSTERPTDQETLSTEQDRGRGAEQRNGGIERKKRGERVGGRERERERKREREVEKSAGD